MTNGQPFSIYTLTTTFALLLCLVLSVQSAKENLETQSDDKVVSNIHKREAETESQDSAVRYNEYHDEPVKRSTNEEETLDIDDLNLPDKRGRARNRYGFFGSLGKRNDLEDVEKRRMRNMFFGSLGKRDDNDDDNDIEKRRQAFFAGLGKREGEMDEEELLDELEKRARGNRYFYGALGKRDSVGEGEEDIDKRGMRFFGSLGKRDPEDDMDKRGRNQRFGFFGSLGKRQGTSTEGDDTDFEEIDDLDKRRYQTGFFGSLGKRDGADLEKRRRMKGYAFASLGKRFDELEDEETDDMEKRRMRMRPSFYGTLGKRRYRTRNLFFGQLGKRSVSSESSDNVMYDDQGEEHSRRKRSLSPFNLSRAFRGNPYGRKRRYNRRIAIGTRLIRRTPSFRIFPTLGKRSSDTFESPQYYEEF